MTEFIADCSMIDTDTDSTVSLAEELLIDAAWYYAIYKENKLEITIPMSDKETMWQCYDNFDCNSASLNSGSNNTRWNYNKSFLLGKESLM